MPTVAKNIRKTFSRIVLDGLMLRAGIEMNDDSLANVLPSPEPGGGGGGGGTPRSFLNRKLQFLPS